MISALFSVVFRALALGFSILAFVAFIQPLFKLNLADYYDPVSIFVCMIGFTFSLSAFHPADLWRTLVHVFHPQVDASKATEYQIGLYILDSMIQYQFMLGLLTSGFGLIQAVVLMDEADAFKYAIALALLPLLYTQIMALFLTLPQRQLHKKCIRSQGT